MQRFYIDGAMQCAVSYQYKTKCLNTNQKVYIFIYYIINIFTETIVFVYRSTCSIEHVILYLNINWKSLYFNKYSKKHCISEKLEI